MNAGVESARNRERDFLERLRPLERDLEIYCRRLLWDQTQVPDAIQNALWRAVRAFDRYDPRASFRAWMFQILTREAFALNRKCLRRARHEFLVEPEELETLAEAGHAEGFPASGVSPANWEENVEDALLAALKTLTENERATLLLQTIGDFRYREIAELLAIPIGSVMGHLSRARQKLRALLAPRFPEREFKE